MRPMSPTVLAFITPREIFAWPVFCLTAVLLWSLAGCGRPPAPDASRAAAEKPADGLSGQVDGPADPPAAAEHWRGIVVSCRRNGPGEWDGPHFGPLLTRLQTLGVNAVQVHPYARISADGAVGYRPDHLESATTQPLLTAADAGMAAFLKPHLAYWRSGFAWRGDITFGDEAHWQRFFAEYTQYIVHQAECAQRGGAALFAVGTELDKTLHREADWREVIRQVRAVYDGPITYAANWDAVARVPFWDALDYVGVQAYYPLSSQRPPTDEQLIAGWKTVLDGLAKLSAEVGRPVVFAELGYAISEEAALRPWDDHQAGDWEAGARLKLRCMRIALEQLDDQPWLAGVFLWKWFADDREQNREFILQYDAMRDVIRGAWAQRVAGVAGGRNVE